MQLRWPLPKKHEKSVEVPGITATRIGCEYNRSFDMAKLGFCSIRQATLFQA